MKIEESNFNKLTLINRKDTDPKNFDKEPSLCNIIFGELPKSAMFGVGQHGIRLETKGFVFFEKDEEVMYRFSEEDCVFISKLVQRMLNQIVSFIDELNVEIVDLNKLQL